MAPATPTRMRPGSRESEKNVENHEEKDRRRWPGSRPRLDWPLTIEWRIRYSLRFAAASRGSRRRFESLEVRCRKSCVLPSMIPGRAARNPEPGEARAPHRHGSPARTVPLLGEELALGAGREFQVHRISGQVQVHGVS